MCEDCGSGKVAFIFDWYRDPEWMEYDPHTLEGDEGEFSVFRILQDLAPREEGSPGYLHLIDNDMYENLRFDDEIQKLPTGRYTWRGTIEFSRDHWEGDYDERWIADSVTPVKQKVE